ncbi:helix-turn-helix domain-containing protein [Microlunatus speluncae]|uniref:helix-turn-helix domain-containing protein n=1 Tax=Microlunatus speluncae TaxID=2594267 RepID=UPI001266369E
MDESLRIEHSWSKALFGNQHMLHIANSIAVGSAAFTAPELERSTGLSASSVHRLLSVLCSVGLVSRVPRLAGERIQRYHRERQPFWMAVSQIRERARGTAYAPHVRGGNA